MYPYIIFFVLNNFKLVELGPGRLLREVLPRNRGPGQKIKRKSRTVCLWTTCPSIYHGPRWKILSRTKVRSYYIVHCFWFSCDIICTDLLKQLCFVLPLPSQKCSPNYWTLTKMLLQIYTIDTMLLIRLY